MGQFLLFYPHWDRDCSSALCYFEHFPKVVKTPNPKRFSTNRIRTHNPQLDLAEYWILDDQLSWWHLLANIIREVHFDIPESHKTRSSMRPFNRLNVLPFMSSKVDGEPSVDASSSFGLYVHSKPEFDANNYFLVFAKVLEKTKIFWSLPPY